MLVSRQYIENRFFAVKNCDTIEPGAIYASLKFFRLGKASQDRIRPIKLILPSESEAINLLKGFAKESSKFGYLKEISLSNDKTPKEMDYFKNLRSTLAARISNGEQDLIIKFIKGIPKIVKKN
ncbi:hypothetical protein J6590_097228 [Homalodisca vitripennis]|nr:hypothetical protein J6590_097228 [Homalodisca vitripennis]